MEKHLDERGEVLPFRAPESSPDGLSDALRSGERGDFHTYNPSLLLLPTGRLVVVARHSNYNFCTWRKGFAENLLAAKGAIMSFLVRGEVSTESWELIPRNGVRGLALFNEVNAQFPTTEVEMVSGPEDPRTVVSGETAYVFVAAWESTKVQWQHLVVLPTSELAGMEEREGAADDGTASPHVRRAGRGAVSGQQDLHGTVATTHSVRLEVNAQYAQALMLWLPQFRQSRAHRDREKNWSPFEWRGGIYLEYSIEPRLVLSLNPATGVSTPVLPLSSSPGVRTWINKLGPVSGGPPSVLLPDHGIYLGMAHVKLWKKKGSSTASSKMMYKHFWYTFEPRPPFRVLGTSSPFTLPSQLDSAPGVQFATGLVVLPQTQQVVVSYGEQDCHATLARFPLAATVASVQTRRRAAEPAVPLLSTLVVLRSAGAVAGAGGLGSERGDAEDAAEVSKALEFLREANASSGGTHRATLLLAESCVIRDELEGELDALQASG